MANKLILPALLMVVAAASTEAQNQTPPPTATATESAETVDQGPRRIGDPYKAYSAGVYDQALQGFVDDQVERPEDPAVLLNIGSAHYKMKNYKDAVESFSRVALSGDPALRAEALYNLGNCAYREGRLQEAVELYKTALELSPEDQDSKFNLEFVRDEIRRRHEEAQKRQEEQQKQNQEQQQEGEQDQDEQGQGEQEQDQQNGQDGQQQQPESQDSDRDGLPDELERSADNPTNPEDADSDDDGLLDGQEDRNANGEVDPDETNPNNPDSDGNGVTDGQEASGEQPQESQQAQAEAGNEKSLTKEEAERYLQGLQEGRPDQKHKAQRGQPRRPAKDW